MDNIPNYHCPVCGMLSGLVIGPTQAFCTADEAICQVLSFNPSLPDGGMSNPKFINLDDCNLKGEEK